MTHFRVETEAPNDRRRAASNCRSMELEDYIVRVIDKDDEFDRATICAANILAYRRLQSIIANAKQYIFVYAPSRDDKWFYIRCCEKEPSREAFESATHLIKGLDAKLLRHGYAMADEVTEAVRKAARYILAGTIR